MLVLATQQSYSKNTFSYLEQVHAFVDRGLSDDAIFDAISTIITRGEYTYLLNGSGGIVPSVHSHINLRARLS